MGRGPLAGPVVAACVVLADDFCVLGVDDSKKISEKRREVLSDEINASAMAVGIGVVDNVEIDRINILNATKKAMGKAIAAAEADLESKGGRIDHILIDALTLEDVDIPQTGIVKGDSKSVSIAAASIIAKVARDRMMREYAEEYPGYSFEKNKGYGTRAHYQGIDEKGITPIHRRTFLRSRGK